MKNNFKKIALSFGVLTTASLPIVAVVSCGSTYNPTDDEISAYRDLTSPTAHNFIENLWQEKTLTDLVYKDVPNDERYKPTHQIVDGKGVHTYWTDTTGQAVKEAAEYFVTSKILAPGGAGKDYLKNMGNTIASSGRSEEGTIDRYSETWLKQNGILATYENGKFTVNATGNTSTDVKGITKEGLEFLFASDLVSFRTDVYKFIITTWYLENTTKTLYETAFKTRVNEGLGDINKLIPDSEYLLMKEMINNKYFAKWEISLSADESRTYIGRANMNYNEALNELTSAGTLDDHLKRSTTLSKYNDVIFKNLTGTVNSHKYSDLFGFAGIQTFSAVGTDELSFTADKMKDVDQRADSSAKTNWEGFVVKDKLNRFEGKSATDSTITSNERTTLDENGIPYIVENGSEVKLTFVHGIMPAFNGTEFVWDLPADTYAANKNSYKHNLAQLFASSKPDYYNDAVEFIRSKDDEGILPAITLTIENEDYKDHLIDAGYKFVEERNV